MKDFGVMMCDEPEINANARLVSALTTNSQYKRSLTDDDFPVLGVVRNLVCRTNFREANSTDDEYN